MLKALSPVFTLTVLSMFGLEKPTLPLIGSVVIIAVGTAIAATGEIQFSWPGTIMMVRGARLRVWRPAVNVSCWRRRCTTPTAPVFF
jgi:hypothetical protein